MRTQNHVKTRFCQKTRHKAAATREHPVAPPGRGHNDGICFRPRRQLLRACDKPVQVRASHQGQKLRRRVTNRFQRPETLDLPLARAEYRVVIIKAEKLVGMHITQRMHHVHVLFHTGTAANLQDVNPRRRQHEDIGFQKSQRRVGRIAGADKLRRHERLKFRIVHVKDRIVFRGRQVRHGNSAFHQRHQHRTPRRPIALRFGINDDLIFLQIILASRRPVDKAADDRREFPRHKVSARYQPHHHGQQHAPGTGIQIRPSVRGRQNDGRCRQHPRFVFLPQGNEFLHLGPVLQRFLKIIQCVRRAVVLADLFHRLDGTNDAFAQFGGTHSFGARKNH